MDIQINNHPLNGNLAAISSKSDAHRAIWLAALADQRTTLQLGQLSQDIEASLSCIEALGCQVIHQNNNQTYQIQPRVNPLKGPFLVGESGTTLRFLLPILASQITSKQEIEIVRQGSLITRTNLPYRQLFQVHGLNWREEGSSIWISGQLTAGHYHLTGDVSSQFVSGLLLALGNLKEASKLTLTSPLESAAYVEMTRHSMQLFGQTIDYHPLSRTYQIPGGGYQACHYIVEGDWSNALFFLVGGAQINNLSTKSLQADRQALAYLQELGYQIPSDFALKNQNPAHIISGSDLNTKLGGLRLTFKPNPTNQNKELTIDARQLPDAIPILSLAAARQARPTRILNGQRLRLKESDRIESTLALLRALSVEVETETQGFLIRGGSSLQGGAINSYQDHRIAMTAAIAGSLAQGPVTIHDAECVAKSYPHFFQDFKKLGGIYHVL